MFQDRSTYFPLRLKFSFFLSVILILFGCKTTKFVDSCISEIGFGSGGGVTGQYIEYTLNSRGELFKYNKSTRKDDLLKNIDLVKTNEIFKKVDNDNLMNYKFNFPGNMNRYIEIRTKGGTNKITWSISDKSLLESIKSIYEELNFFLK